MADQPQNPDDIQPENEALQPLPEPINLGMCLEQKN